jgi:predicted phage tail protein
MNSDNAEVLGSAKAYKVLDIAREAKNIFSITAVEHYNQKFTAIEEEYELGAIPDSAYVEREPSVIPPPRNLTASFEGPQANPQGEILLAWDYPVDDSWVNFYEIVHDIPDTDTPIPTSSNGMVFKGFD